LVLNIKVNGDILQQQSFINSLGKVEE
jgi:hypothetical protein